MLSENVDIVTEVFSSARQRLRNVAGRFLHSSDDVADVIQEAFCRLWPKRDSIHTTNDAMALATTTTRNLCIDKLRSSARHVNVVIDEERDAAEVTAPDVAFDAREQFDIVNAIIEENLSETQRKILKLREFDGLDNAEIAARLGMDETAVRMNLSRARKKIREIYNEMNR